MGRRPKDVFSYNDYFFSIVELVAIKNQPAFVDVPTIAKARALRGRFYAFRQSLERAIHQGLEKPRLIEGEQIADLQATLQYARVTNVFFDEKKGEPVQVCFMHKNQTPEALLLKAGYERAAAKAGSTPAAEGAGEQTAEEAEETHRRLMEKVGKIDPKKNPYY